MLAESISFLNRETLKDLDMKLYNITFTLVFLTIICNIASLSSVPEKLTLKSTLQFVQCNADTTIGDDTTIGSDLSLEE
jgi:hypothetical protein